ncbi:hypothetical protein BX600DRAFT_466832 [Xylariales sp. PMI_506]|nr:hypothetical protein BX600DRAFT_466832 [Xylariales sp. PMI_506]
MFKSLPIASFAILAAIGTASADLIHVPRAEQLATRELSVVMGLVDRSSSSCQDTCTSSNGNTICMDIGDYCCQAGGTEPFVCPSGYPYCCPGELCGSSSSCSGPIVDENGNPIHGNQAGHARVGAVAAVVAVAAALI